MTIASIKNKYLRRAVMITLVPPLALVGLVAIPYFVIRENWDLLWSDIKEGFQDCFKLIRNCWELE